MREIRSDSHKGNNTTGLIFWAFVVGSHIPICPYAHIPVYPGLWLGSYHFAPLGLWSPLVVLPKKRTK
jgi:hypothetical protein